jgi:hypothetical protein
LLVKVSDEVFVGLEAFLSLHKLLLEGLVDLLHVSEFHFRKLVLLQTCDGLSLELINLVSFLGEALLQLVELLLFGLVLGTDLLTLSIQFLNDLVSFAYFVLC